MVGLQGNVRPTVHGHIVVVLVPAKFGGWGGGGGAMVWCPLVGVLAPPCGGMTEATIELLIACVQKQGGALHLSSALPVFPCRLSKPPEDPRGPGPALARESILIPNR